MKSSYFACGVVGVMGFVALYFAINYPQFYWTFAVLFVPLAVALLVATVCYDAIRGRFEVLKLKFSHAYKRAIGFDALEHFFGADFRCLVNICEHISPRNIRNFIEAYLDAYLRLKSEVSDNEEFDLRMNEIIDELKQKYHLDLKTYGIELGNPQSGLCHLDLVVRCSICGSQVLDLAQYHKQLHAVKTL
jgi:hypothetical protein